jgi:hypothetical protein
MERIHPNHLFVIFKVSIEVQAPLVPLKIDFKPLPAGTKPKKPCKRSEVESVAKSVL